jgi:hypothetical protein
MGQYENMHNALAYHCVREMIAAKILGIYWIDEKKNAADIVSNLWSYPQVWHLLHHYCFILVIQRI